MAVQDPEGDSRRLTGHVAIAEAAVSAVGVVSLVLFFGIAQSTGSTQPWGTISDLSGLIFFLVLTCFLVLVRRIPDFLVWSGASAVAATGFASASTGIVGSVFLVWVELGGPTYGIGERLAGLGLGIQYVSTVLLISWCISFGYQLKRLGWSQALRWGVVGATFVGAPAWFAWLGRRVLVTAESGGASTPPR